MLFNCVLKNMTHPKASARVSDVKGAERQHAKSIEFSVEFYVKH